MVPVMMPFIVMGVFFHSKSLAALKLFFGLIWATIFTRCLKLLVKWPRPTVGHIVEPGNSGFPSDHSLSAAFACAFILSELRQHKIQPVLLAAFFNIGLMVSPIIIAF